MQCLVQWRVCIRVQCANSGEVWVGKGGQGNGNKVIIIVGIIVVIIVGIIVITIVIVTVIDMINIIVS